MEQFACGGFKLFDREYRRAYLTVAEVEQLIKAVGPPRSRGCDADLDCVPARIAGDRDRQSERPATLNDGAGTQTDCATLQEAVLAWQRLTPEQKTRATVKLIGGPVYTAHQIARFHYGTKQA